MDLYRADPCTISYIQTIHWRGNCFLSRSSLLVSKTISTQLLMRIRTTTITNRVTNTPATFQSFSHSVPDYFKVVQINVHTYSLWFSPWKRGSMTEPEKKADHGTSTTDRCYQQFSIRGWNFDKPVWNISRKWHFATVVWRCLPTQTLYLASTRIRPSTLKGGEGNSAGSFLE